MTRKTQRRPACGTKKNAKAPPRRLYALRLYITGQTPLSETSLRNLNEVCAQHLAGHFELEVIDIYQQPQLAREAQILAAPTLIKRLPLPFRRLVGDLSNRKQVLFGLDIQDVQQEKPKNG
jgi:circadian clock protein KaiB